MAKIAGDKIAGATTKIAGATETQTRGLPHYFHAARRSSVSASCGGDAGSEGVI
jgi:hypothetical protein